MDSRVAVLSDMKDVWCIFCFQFGALQRCACTVQLSTSWTQTEAVAVRSLPPALARRTHVPLASRSLEEQSKIAAARAWIESVPLGESGVLRFSELCQLVIVFFADRSG